MHNPDKRMLVKVADAIMDKALPFIGYMPSDPETIKNELTYLAAAAYQQANKANDLLITAQDALVALEKHGAPASILVRLKKAIKEVEGL